MFVNEFLHLSISSLVCSVMLHPSLLYMVSFIYMLEIVFCSVYYPENQLCQSSGLHFFNWPWKSCLQLWYLRCQACASSLTTPCLRSSAPCPVPPLLRSFATVPDLYFSTLHHCVNISFFMEFFFMTTIYIKLWLHCERIKLAIAAWSVREWLSQTKQSCS